LFAFLHTTSPGELLPEWSISLSPHGSLRLPGYRIATYGL
jgi:hypothetical protein